MSAIIKQKPNHQLSKKIEEEAYTGSAPSITPDNWKPPEEDFKSAIKVDGAVLQPQEQDAMNKQQNKANRKQEKTDVSDMAGDTNSNQATSFVEAKAVPMADVTGGVNQEPPAAKSKETSYSEARYNQHSSTNKEVTEKMRGMSSKQATDKRSQEQLVTNVTTKSTVAEFPSNNHSSHFHEDRGDKPFPSDQSVSLEAMGLRNNSGVSDDVRGQRRVDRQVSEPSPDNHSSRHKQPLTKRSKSVQLGAPTDWNEQDEQHLQEDLAEKFYDAFLLYSKRNEVEELKEMLKVGEKEYCESFQAGTSLFQNLDKVFRCCSFIVPVLTKEFLEDDKLGKFGDTSVVKSLEDHTKRDFVIPIVIGLTDEEIPTAFKSITCLKPQNHFFSVQFVKTINSRVRLQREYENEKMIDEAREKRKEEKLESEIERLKEMIRRKERMDSLKREKLALEQQLQDPESTESGEQTDVDCIDDQRGDGNNGSAHNYGNDEVFRNGDDGDGILPNECNDAGRHRSDINVQRSAAGVASPSFRTPKSGGLHRNAQDQRRAYGAMEDKMDDDEQMLYISYRSGWSEGKRDQEEFDAEEQEYSRRLCASNKDAYSDETRFGDLERYSNLKSLPPFADPRKQNPEHSMPPGDTGESRSSSDFSLLMGANHQTQRNRVTDLGSPSGSRSADPPQHHPIDVKAIADNTDISGVQQGIEDVHEKRESEDNTEVKKLYATDTTVKDDDTASKSQDNRAQKQNGSHADYDKDIEELCDNDEPLEKQKQPKKKKFFRRPSFRRKKKQKPPKDSAKDANHNAKKKKDKSSKSSLASFFGLGKTKSA